LDLMRDPPYNLTPLALWPEDSCKLTQPREGLAAGTHKKKWHRGSNSTCGRALTPPRRPTQAAAHLRAGLIILARDERVHPQFRQDTRAQDSCDDKKQPD